MTVITEMRRVR